MLTNFRSLNRVGQKGRKKAGGKNENLLGFCAGCVTKHLLHGAVPVRPPILFIGNIKMNAHIVVVSL